MYYEVTGDSKNSYTRLVFLNELVSGQNIDYVDNLMTREREHSYEFSRDDCYVCLTGLKKSVYSGKYGVSTNQYMHIYVEFEKKFSEHIKKRGYVGEIFLHLYEDKQIVIIFSKKNSTDILPSQIVQYAQDCLQLIYCEHFLYDGVYCNQIYFCEEPTNLHQIAAELKKLIDLSKLNFFYMEPVVITHRKKVKLQRFNMESDMRELKQSVISAINSGNYDACKNLIEELMLNRIKFSFDFYSLQDTALFLKNFYLECCIAYGINLQDNVDYLFDYSNYEKIETFTEKLVLLFEKIIYTINQKDKRYSQLIQKTIRIINTSFHKSDISVAYLASYVNVSPSYLSSIFNREVEMSVSQYLTELRISKAKQLLEETNMLISDISLSVGYCNKRYFTDVFKKKVGCTPKDYRSTIIC